MHLDKNCTANNHISDYICEGGKQYLFILSRWKQNNPYLSSSQEEVAVTGTCNGIWWPFLIGCSWRKQQGQFLSLPRTPSLHEPRVPPHFPITVRQNYLSPTAWAHSPPRGAAATEPPPAAAGATLPHLPKRGFHWIPRDLTSHSHEHPRQQGLANVLQSCSLK